MRGWGQKSGLGRPGEPSEVATSFVFLASPDAALYCKLATGTISWADADEISLWTDGQVMHCYPLGD